MENENSAGDKEDFGDGFWVVMPFLLGIFILLAVGIFGWIIASSGKFWFIGLLAIGFER